MQIQITNANDANQYIVVSFELHETYNFYSAILYNGDEATTLFAKYLVATIPGQTTFILGKVFKDTFRWTGHANDGEQLGAVDWSALGFTSGVVTVSSETGCALTFIYIGEKRNWQNT